MDSVSDVKNSLQDRKQQRMQLDLMQSLNRGKLAQDKVQPEIEGIIESYELAYRMQDAMPTVMSLSDETEATLRMYGADVEPTRNFGGRCFLARRLVEAGVRFVQVSHGNWDNHQSFSTRHPATAGKCDKSIAGLLQDLKQCDLLKDTLPLESNCRKPLPKNGCCCRLEQKTTVNCSVLIGIDCKLLAESGASFGCFVDGSIKEVFVLRVK